LASQVYTAVVGGTNGRDLPLSPSQVASCALNVLSTLSHVTDKTRRSSVYNRVTRTSSSVIFF